MKRILPIALILSLLASLLAGCGGAQPVPAEEAAPQEAEMPSPEQPVAPARTAAPEAAGVTAYTIRFDLNTTPDDTADDEIFEYEEQGYDANWQPVTETKLSVLTVPYSEDAYIPAAIPAPEREGYAFAGWQTRALITEADLVHGVSPYLWLFGTQSSFGDPSVVMPIKDMETLDENGVGTLYARWVEVKDISTEAELRAMANDLYGAYRLTADIELTEPWTPIGLYFSNYEFYMPEWWIYAFHGSLDGNGHTISGLRVLSAKADVSAYQGENVVWHNDGERADGCAAMFGAITSASISNLTLEAPVIDVTGDLASHGDYVYAAPVAAFDSKSVLRHVTVNDPRVSVESSDEESAHLPSIFVALSGMIAGGWNDRLEECRVNGGEVSITANTKVSHGGEVYAGGLVGECYSDLIGCFSSAAVITNVNDCCEASEDAELKVNVGGLSAASTVTTGSETDAEITVRVSKPVGAASINVGAMSGAQRYMSSSADTIKAVITADCELDEVLGSLNVGAVSGQIDVFYTLQILMYTPVATTGCTDMTTEVTFNGETLDAWIGMIPELNGTPLGWINKGEYEITEGYVVPSNIEAVAEKYGSYLPVEYLQNGIIWIQAG